MKIFRKLLFTIFILLLFTNSDAVSQTTWYINNSGSGDAPTIQIGIDLASDGDSIIVAPGIYTGIGNRDINFNGKKIILISEYGPKATIIDCTEDGRGFEFNTGEDSMSVLEGFTITNGSESNGGGIHLYSSPKIINCIIDNNSAVNGGGGIFVVGSPIFRNCIISNNSAFSGGGVFIGGTTTEPIFEHCLFSGNSGFPTQGGAVYVSVARPSFTNCTFTFNTSYIYALGTFPKFENCIIAYNGSSIYFDRDPNIVHDLTEISCTNIYGNSQQNWDMPILYEFEGINGNISLDPLFCDTASNSFTVDYSSPCLPDNNDCAALIGAFGEGCHKIRTYISPDPLYLFMANSIASSSISIVTNEIPSAYNLTDVEINSILINGSFIPDSVVQITDHPVVTDPALYIYIDSRDFLISYGFLSDTTIQPMTISGLMSDSTGFMIESEFTLIGHISGDVNSDGLVNMADIINMIAYYFQQGEQPIPVEVLDINRDNAVNITDMVSLIDILFG